MSELLHFIQDQEAAFRNQNRLASLYSDFAAQKQLNPDGYTANLSAWKKALWRACRSGKIPNVAADAQAPQRGGSHDAEGKGRTDCLSFSTGEELGRALELRPYGRPTGLQEVLKDALDRREIIPLQDFLGQEESIYSRRWIPTPWEIVRWGLRSLSGGYIYGNHSLTVGRFVVVENVEAAAKGVWERQRVLDTSPTSRVYSLKTFSETFGTVLGEGCALSEKDFQVLLRYMSRDRPSLSYEAETGTIKFAPSETTRPTPVEANDISIAQVKTLQISLTQAIPPLEARHAELDAKLRNAVATKQMSAAKSFLRAKKLVETTLEQRRNNLLQVEESLHAIETAATNVEIVSAMQESTKVMRDLNSRVGGVEGVEKITDALRDEMETAEDIGRVMMEPGASSAVDEGEVDEEFEALLAGEKAKEEEARRKVEEEQRAKEEEETREKMRSLEEWERGQKVAREAQAAKEAEAKQAADAAKQKEAEAKRKAEEEDAELERRMEELRKQKEDEKVESMSDSLGEMSLNKEAENKEKEGEGKSRGTADQLLAS